MLSFILEGKTQNSEVLMLQRTTLMKLWWCDKGWIHPLCDSVACLRMPSVKNPEQVSYASLPRLISVIESGLRD